MLPSFTATNDLARFVSNRAQELSDADRILCRHGFGTAQYSNDAVTLNRYILSLFDAAVAIARLSEPVETYEEWLDANPHALDNE